MAAISWKVGGGGRGTCSPPPKKKKKKKNIYIYIPGGPQKSEQSIFLGRLL